MKKRLKQNNTIGEIPNVLALAHWITTTPAIQQPTCLIFATPAERAQCAAALNALHHTQALEWQGALFDIPKIVSHNGFLFVDMETLQAHRLPAPDLFFAHSHTLRIDDMFNSSALATLLAESGWEREERIELPGQYTVRGNVIDIFIDQALRIECGEERIEQMWSFEMLSGEKIAHVTEISIPPLSLIGEHTLFDYIDDRMTTAAFDTLHEEELDYHISPLRVGDGENAGYRLSPAYHLRYEKLQQDTAGKTIHLFSDFPDRLNAVLPHAQIYPSLGAIEGIVHEQSNTVLLSDDTIGFREEKQKKRSKRVLEAMLGTLEPGQYVVHLFHGIARFSGMETMHINGRDRDYFVLEYAQKDKIYVPVEMAERIDAYLGDPHPTLHRLSTASWNEVVMRIKKETQQMASELLTLYARREKAQAPALLLHDGNDIAQEKQLDSECAFDLTPDQETALADVLADIEHSTPMDRLLCGDVGFGKTEVALRAAYRAVLCGYQVALLAPTTVLAMQHVDTLTKRLQQHNVRIAVMSRMQSTAEQKKTLDALQAGSLDIVIGTHRLLSKDVAFKKLGLVIIDEEQRFGVRAKEALKKMRSNTHILTMTATPIPRTLHLSLAGVRNISTILTPPHTRKAVHTVITRLNEDVVRQAIEREMQRNGQTYYIYNRVETIEMRRAQLQKIVPHARIGVAHGQLSTEELTHVMHAFDVGNIDVLLASTIVENGLDIPEANTLIVENASRFGLAQLYQLKGRVGRSERQGYAYFLYKEQTPAGDVQKRFLALEQAQALGSGFELAMKDMEIRGVGNILGKEQHGHAVKIGLHLYIRLLNQAMQELEGEELTLERDIPIDLPIEGRIPEEVLEEQGDRILLYQQLANIRDIDELQERRLRYERDPQFQHHGTLHPSIAGLFDVLEIKLLCAHSILVSIDTQYDRESTDPRLASITITADAELPGLDGVWDVVGHGDYAYRRARARIADLGEAWRERLKFTIGQLQKKSNNTTERNTDKRVEEA